VDSRTGRTVELLQTLIRNECVNDGTRESGQEVRNADVLTSVLEDAGAAIERFEPAPGRVSIVSRIEGRDAAAPVLCLMAHTDVVPVDLTGWTRDPFAGELIDGEVWGRGAVDMLNLTSSMALAYAEFAASGRRPRGDVVFFGVADEESGSAYGAGWMAEHARDAIRADFVLTEFGGVHSRSDGAGHVGISVAEKGVAWRRLRVRGAPGHGSMPYRSDNALVKAAAVIQRLASYNPPARFTELWPIRVSTLDVDDETKAILLDEERIDDVLASMPNAKAAAQLHACTHTTFSPNVADGVMKTNIIPGIVDIKVDIRTLPGEDDDDVANHLRTALGDLADEVEVEVLLHEPASISRTDNALWDALERAVRRPFPSARISPQLTVAFTDARVYRQMGAVAYGAGLLSPSLDNSEFSRRFHGNDERIDVESLELTTRLWLDVIDDLAD
jgi:acetylornithine deacetylase/succinyl-diaminopimelate desuccinylase-like protein